MRCVVLVLLFLGLTVACGGDDGGGSGGTGAAAGTGGSSGGAAGTGGAAGAGGGTASHCGSTKFVASCKSNDGTGSCFDFHDDTSSSDAIKPVCDVQGPGTLDAAAKCDPTTGFGACAIEYISGSCRVYYWGPPQYTDASAAMDICKTADGTWYPH